MARAAWLILAGIAVVFTAWFAATATMADIDLGCAKVAETGAAYECDDRIISVLGVWPLIWLGVLLTTPPVVAAIAGRVWVSCVSVAALVAVAIVGLANWTDLWGTLLFAFPLALLGAVVTAVHQARRRPRET